MRLRVLLLWIIGVLGILGVYYAGYLRGVHSRLSLIPSTPVAARPDGEADRLLEPIAVPDDYDVLLSRRLEMPLAAIKRSDIIDTFNVGRPGGKRHEATDIMAPRDTPVHAVEDGTIRKLFLSKAGGNTIYEFDPEAVYCFYYAHLDHYADGIRQGMEVRKGDIIGYVGSTGDASPNAPHLHFAIVKLGPEKNWWQGTPINPYPILIALARSDH